MVRDHFPADAADLMFIFGMISIRTIHLLIALARSLCWPAAMLLDKVPHLNAECETQANSRRHVSRNLHQANSHAADRHRRVKSSSWNFQTVSQQHGRLPGKARSIERNCFFARNTRM